jgi:hypothetical protein
MTMYKGNNITQQTNIYVILSEAFFGIFLIVNVMWSKNHFCLVPAFLLLCLPYTAYSVFIILLPKFVLHNNYLH